MYFRFYEHDLKVTETWSFQHPEIFSDI
jgi:hypothetical protein